MAAGYSGGVLVSLLSSYFGPDFEVIAGFRSFFGFREFCFALKHPQPILNITTCKLDMKDLQ
jgi:hypothetical protein